MFSCEVHEISPNIFLTEHLGKTAFGITFARFWIKKKQLVLRKKILT